MPRYFFDIRDGDTDTDSEGVELPDLRAARAEAIKFAGAYVSNNPSLLDETGDLTVNLLDETRQPLFCVMITSADLRGSSASS